MGIATRRHLFRNASGDRKCPIYRDKKSIQEPKSKKRPLISWYPKEVPANETKDLDSAICLSPSPPTRSGCRDANNCIKPRDHFNIIQNVCSTQTEDPSACVKPRAGQPPTRDVTQSAKPCQPRSRCGTRKIRREQLTESYRSESLWDTATAEGQTQSMTEGIAY